MEDPAEEIEEIIDELNRRQAGKRTKLKTGGEVFPGDTVPVLANSRRRNVRPFAMRWGYSMQGGRMIINARSETASVKPMFKDGMAQRRCIIPASKYYEWENCEGEKIRYEISPSNGRMMYMAGIYRLENCEGGTMPSFTILTRQAAKQIAFIHPRMPVIFSPECVGEWLSGEGEVEQLLSAAFTDVRYIPA